RGDRVLLARQIDAVPLLGGRRPGTVERDRLRLRQLPARDHVGLGEEPPGLGAPGLLALLAVIRDQIVIPGDAVHRGAERVLFQPAPVQPVGQVTCCAHATFRKIGHGSAAGFPQSRPAEAYGPAAPHPPPAALQERSTWRSGSCLLRSSGPPTPASGARWLVNSTQRVIAPAILPP